MRIWGYLLICLNIAAAGAFVYLATALRQKQRPWTAATFKAELQLKGTSLEEGDRSEELEEGNVPFSFKLNGIEDIGQLPKDTLKKLIPTGGTSYLANTENEAVTNQSQEVERVRKKVFAEVDKLKDGQQRQFIQTLLLNLAKTGQERDGIYALLRDMPQPMWRSFGRRDLPFLGRTAQQVDALRLLLAISPLADDLARQNEANITAARAAVASWARGAINQAIQAPIPDAKGVRPDQTTYRQQLQAADAALRALLLAVDQGKADANAISQGKQRLIDSAPNSPGPTVMPIVASLAGNSLRTAAQVADARQQILELVQMPTRTEAEKEALVGVVDLLMPPPLDANTPPAERAAREEERLNQGIVKVGRALLKHHFDEAALAASANKDKTPLRDPGEKKYAIAHLLYHLDAHLFPKAADRKAWHERVVAIVGYEAYVIVAEEQASRLNAMITRAQSYIVEEQTVFLDLYSLLVEYAIYLSQRVDVLAQQLKEQEKLLDQHKAQAESREAEQKVLEDQLAAARTATRQALQSLRDRQNELYTITRQLGDAQDALIGLEVRLRTIEQSLVRP